MYKFYLGATLLPIAPESIKTKVSSGNKTFTLIDSGEINILKSAKLSSFEFDVILPNVQYPFAEYDDGIFHPAGYYLEILEDLLKDMQPFQFKINRIMPNGNILFDTDTKVSLEEYTIAEDADYGFDVKVSIKLKKYNDWSTQTVKVDSSTNKATTTKTRSASTTNEPTPKTDTVETYTIKSGDTLWSIAKKYYGDGSLCYKLATYNSISNPNLIYTGNTLKIPSLETVKSQSPTYGTAVKKDTTPTVNKVANFTFSGNAQKDAAATALATMHSLDSTVSTAKAAIKKGNGGIGSGGGGGRR